MLEFHFNPLPTLYTKRLKLRPLLIKDAQAMFELRSNKETMKYIPRVLPTCIEDAKEHLRHVIDLNEKNECLNWGITLINEDLVIGTIGYYRIKWEHFRGEIGYMLEPKFHKQGLMNEALKCLLDFGFEEIKFHTIEAVIDPRNEASRNILLKNDFIKEAHFKENEYFDGKFLDSEVYTKFNNNQIC